MSHPAYFILEVAIKDHEAMQPYLDKAAATLTAFGGVPIAGSGNIVPLEGDAPAAGSKVVMLRFDSMETAQAWYHSPAYQAILGHRLQAADNRAYLVEGVA
ncbi:DUF1330 domain-containing protein [Testudinibacter sp. TR-2022]|uniref:DUF1330 domain-containing protein n=1 Tax=Testudinibacter sp. TR-2022 TaxID=2585029 RepID=UPI00111B44E9|nr:DUF1330 domain-containing protein [Testudinibacter sp. TR-2022]TNH07000.1 DUF1330 domain-containing protein [Pasteurellaceae bacterium Phil11]TNH22861.1 DUF1330 domain-containing protein [Testudinibacter sp. TR-2022]TNH25289.1 DUF1330 domain-containing protein [Testudinibacter sp. TR-2022]